MQDYLDEDLLPRSCSEETDSTDQICHPLNSVNAGQGDVSTPCGGTTCNQGCPAGGKHAVHLFSFGFGWGARPPRPMDKIFDCRVLTNPSKVSRTGRTGLDKRLREEVLNAPGTEEFVKRSVEHIVRELTCVERGDEGSVRLDGCDASAEQKSRHADFCFAFGCHGGEHRSVSVVLEVERRLKEESQRNPRLNAFEINVEHMVVS
eukprot:gnl/TRDRNA2_/TRDRNA2_171005_c1_seq1.p1 gnl/TRDRNA2_/TRDRNA2_171005_c1~~gnl/TRDRNA2_/TRDRNA2_171005_c1_seq1.p1  ORF type:complete len:205 (+),score=21.58 gnl/TRDRNA2_/TRDRNA2_171005_c1_seq1:188-802(+)